MLKSLDPGTPGPSQRSKAIALNSQGQRGLITEDQPRLTLYPDGTTALAHVGLHMGPERLGQPWYSRQPHIIRTVDDKQYRILRYLLDRWNRQAS